MVTDIGNVANVPSDQRVEMARCVLLILYSKNTNNLNKDNNLNNFDTCQNYKPKSPRNLIKLFKKDKSSTK